MLSVVNNLSAMNSQRQFNITGASIQSSMEKLSSGFRINSAADDAAGLTISEKMRSLIRGMNQGSDNIQDGISVMQIADGALSEVHSMLHRMTELSIKAANGTNTAADRQAIQSEINELSSEITRIGKSTTYNTMYILDNGKTVPDPDSAADLVKCKSAASGLMSEVYEYNGKYYIAAELDFSALNSDKIRMLDGKSFSFACGYGCGETFKFTFKDDTTASSVDDDIQGGGKTHTYTVGTQGLTTGNQLASALYGAVEAHPIKTSSGGTYGPIAGGLHVSHATGFAKKAGEPSILVVFHEHPFDTEQEALASDERGAIDCSEIMNTGDDLVISYNIQCSNVQDDCETIETYRMNAKTLGVDIVNVSTQEAARGAIAQIEKAVDKVSEQRSRYGAFQNRLEHSYNNNTNKAENMTDAESRIRDTDMASEMVSLTKNNILSQAGSAMLSQAMQNPQSVLQLLS